MQKDGKQGMDISLTVIVTGEADDYLTVARRLALTIQEAVDCGEDHIVFVHEPNTVLSTFVSEFINKINASMAARQIYVKHVAKKPPYIYDAENVIVLLFGEETWTYRKFKQFDADVRKA